MKFYEISPPFAIAPTLSLSEEEVHIIKTLYDGKLTEEQQKKFFEILVYKICRLQGPSHAQNPHDSARNEGQRLVGIYLSHVVNTPFDQL